MAGEEGGCLLFLQNFIDCWPFCREGEAPISQLLQLMWSSGAVHAERCVATGAGHAGGAWVALLCDKLQVGNRDVSSPLLRLCCQHSPPT